jgi:hypothetical protein
VVGHASNSSYSGGLRDQGPPREHTKTTKKKKKKKKKNNWRCYCWDTALTKLCVRCFMFILLNPPKYDENKCLCYRFKEVKQMLGLIFEPSQTAFIIVRVKYFSRTPCCLSGRRLTFDILGHWYHSRLTCIFHCFSFISLGILKPRDILCFFSFPAPITAVRTPV